MICHLSLSPSHEQTGLGEVTDEVDPTQHPTSTNATSTSSSTSSSTSLVAGSPRARKQVYRKRPHSRTVWWVWRCSKHSVHIMYIALHTFISSSICYGREGERVVSHHRALYVFLSSCQVGLWRDTIVTHYSHCRCCFIFFAWL